MTAAGFGVVVPFQTTSIDLLAPGSALQKLARQGSPHGEGSALALVPLASLRSHALFPLVSDISDPAREDC